MELGCCVGLLYLIGYDMSGVQAQPSDGAPMFKSLQERVTGDKTKNRTTFIKNLFYLHQSDS